MEIKIPAMDFVFFSKSQSSTELLISLLFESGLGMKLQTFFFFFLLESSLFIYFFNNNNWTTQPPVSRVLLSPFNILAPLCPVYTFRHFIKLVPMKIHLINWDSQQWLSLPGKTKKELNHPVTLPAGEGKIHEFPLFCLLWLLYKSVFTNTPCE